MKMVANKNGKQLQTVIHSILLSFQLLSFQLFGMEKIGKIMKWTKKSTG